MDGALESSQINCCIKRDNNSFPSINSFVIMHTFLEATILENTKWILHSFSFAKYYAVTYHKLKVLHLSHLVMCQWSKLAIFSCFLTAKKVNVNLIPFRCYGSLCFTQFLMSCMLKMKNQVHVVPNQISWKINHMLKLCAMFGCWNEN